MGMEATEAYRATRERISALLRGGGPDVADRGVPACPKWTVREVAAHLAGACDDVLAGRLEGVATDEWTAAQVTARADRSLDDILDEWAESGRGSRTCSGTEGCTPAALRRGHPRARHPQRARPARRAWTTRRSRSRSRSSVRPSPRRSVGRAPVLTFRWDGEELVLADDEDGAPAQATLTATVFDLVRSCSGRRTLDQISALDWGGADPSPWLPAFTWGPFTLPTDPVETPDAGLSLSGCSAAARGRTRPPPAGRCGRPSATGSTPGRPGGRGPSARSAPSRPGRRRP